MKTSLGWIVKLSSSPDGNLPREQLARNPPSVSFYPAWPSLYMCCRSTALRFHLHSNFFFDENIYLHRTSLFSQPIHQIKDFKRWPTVKDLALRGKKHTLESALEGPNWIYNNKKPFKSWNSWLSPSCSKKSCLALRGSQRGLYFSNLFNLVQNMFERLT